MSEVKPVAIRSFTQDDKVFLETDIMGYVTHQMLDLREKVVQDALRTLGWKSPDDHQRAVEALRAENEHGHALERMVEDAERSACNAHVAD